MGDLVSQHGLAELSLDDGFIAEDIIERHVGLNDNICPECKLSDGLRYGGFSNRKEQRLYCYHCSKANGGRRRTFLRTYGKLTYYVHRKEEIMVLTGIMCNGERLTVREISKKLGISASTSLRYRHKVGCSLEDMPEEQNGSSSESAEKREAQEESNVIGYLEFAHMEKGGSDRGVPETLRIAEQVSEDGEVLDARDVRLSDTFTLLQLRLSSEGTVFGVELDRGTQIPSLKATHTEAVLRYGMELKSYIEDFFKGVSSRYLCTYVNLKRMAEGKFRLLSAFSYALKKRSRDLYQERSKSDIWTHRKVHYPAT